MISLYIQKPKLSTYQENIEFQSLVDTSTILKEILENNLK